MIVAVLGEELTGDMSGSTIVSPISLENLTRLFEQLESLQIECHEIVHLAGMSSTECPRAAAEARCVCTPLLVQAIMQSQMTSKPRLTLVSSMAVAPPCGSGVLLTPNRRHFGDLGVWFRLSIPNCAAGSSTCRLTSTIRRRPAY